VSYALNLLVSTTSSRPYPVDTCITPSASCVGCSVNVLVQPVGTNCHRQKTEKWNMTSNSCSTSHQPSICSTHFLAIRMAYLAMTIAEASFPCTWQIPLFSLKTDNGWRKKTINVCYKSILKCWKAGCGYHLDK
jgi:hypothetical protein